MMKYLTLILLTACSQLSLKVDDKPRNDIQFVAHKNYQEIRGGENLLRNVSGATLQIEFRQTGKQETPQDMLAFSVGGSEQKSRMSRASLRLDPGGRLTGVARSTDTEESQAIRAKILIPPGKTHIATLTIDYPSHEMKLYLDGKELETEGKVFFQAKASQDTPSISASIGAEDDGSDFFFEGTLSNPQIWTRKLSPEEVARHAGR